MVTLSILLLSNASIWILVGLFFIIAFFYSSVGFGGGSSYLAILALFGLGFDDLRIIALLCNIVVVTGSVIIYFRQGFYKQSKILSLIGLSVPLAFIGGMIRLNDNFFFILLGITLIVASMLMWLPKRNMENPNQPKTHIKNTVIGGAIGFLSGLVGIGGGIFLSPYLNLTKYDAAIKIAAYSSLFILVNSVAGLLGQWTTAVESTDYSRVVYLLLAVFLGGQLGVRFGLKKLQPIWVKRVTAILIGIVGCRVLWENI